MAGSSLRVAGGITFLIGESCLFGRKSKLIPTAEPELRVCRQYSENACCSQDQINAPSLHPFPWELCGPLSSRCESYLRRVQCMYLCSPHISAWGDPDSATGIKELPLCQGFCDHWFDACKEDLICTDSTSSATNCSQGCDTYTQIFGTGRQLCDNIWNHSFVTVPKPCFCITPPGEEPSQDFTPEEPDNNQEGPSGYSELCPTAPPEIIPKQRTRRALRKKRVFVEDVEGSGSGF
ncbi:retbindin [Bombina bombina]|uniref:retbindin n=1 Tax=Bombina bombina TaxID=8345 RepID=UPI00235AC1DC|nr:retbindin [Bombina bombina]